MKIVFASQKGGTGKSTAVVNVAAELARRGKSHIIVDCDRKNSSSSLWVTYRDEFLEKKSGNAKGVPCTEKTGRCDKSLKELSKNYRYVLADTPGHDSAEMRSALLVADLVVVPMQCSQFDIDTMNTLYKLLEDALTFNVKMRVVYYESNAETHPAVAKKEAEELRLIMTDYPVIRPLFIKIGTTVAVRHRRAFKTCLPHGLGVTDQKDKKAILEIQDLTNAILKQECK